MSFFDELAPPEQEIKKIAPRREPWRGTPDDTLGIPLPFAEILAHNDEVTVLISGLMAFPAGFSFSVIRFSRLNPPRVPFEAFMAHHPGVPEGDGPFRFGVGLADGTKLLGNQNLPWRPEGPERHMLRPQGGGGGGRRWQQGFLLEPLPPPGTISFVCEWASYGLAESRVELDAKVVLDAAEKARPLWPDDVGLPEPPKHPPRTGATTSTSTGSTSTVFSASPAQANLRSDQD